MPLSFVQSNHGSTGSFGPVNLSVSFSSAVTQGNLLLAILGEIDNLNNIPANISDTMGNKWTQVGSTVNNGGGLELAVFWCIAKASGSNSVSMSFTGPNLNSYSTGMVVAEYSGMNIVDQFASNLGNYTTALSTGSITTSQAVEGVLGIVLMGGFNTTGGLISAGSGYTARENFQNVGVDGSVIWMCLEDQFTSFTENANPTATAQAPVAFVSLTVSFYQKALVLFAVDLNLPNGQAGVNYSYALSASGGNPPYSWKVASGALPTGLSLSSTGTISGIPTATGSFSAVIQVTDSNLLTDYVEVNVQIVPGVLNITTTNIPSGQASVAYSTNLVAVGGTPPYSWGISAGTLPPGLTLSSTGTISGTPSQAGAFNFTLQVKDSSSPQQSASQSYAVVVSAQNNTVDVYGGLLNSPSPHGATGVWRIEKFGSRWMFVTPSGNAFWKLGVFAADTNVPPKYPSSPVWGAQTVRRLASWGFNSTAPYASNYVLPFGAYSPSSTSPSGQYMPTVLLMRPSWYGLLNTGSYAPGPFKALEDCLDSNHYTGWVGDGPPDVYDPNFTTYVNGSLQARLSTDILANSPWVIGVTVDDADQLQGFGPGTDIPGLDGVVHTHIGWIAACTSPTKSSSAKYGASYTDTTVYTKKALHDFLVSKYTTVAAMNAAWGSNYTTFDSAGGWGTGTGFMDENGKNTAWLGTSDGVLTNASAGVVADLNAFLSQYATQYFSVVSAAVRKILPGYLVFGPASINGHGGATRPQVLQAAGQYLDVLNASMSTQAVVDYTGKYYGDKPVVSWEGFFANPDSDLSAYPNPNTVWGFSTQAARGQNYAARVNFLYNAKVAATGSFPVVGLDWWAWQDSNGEKTNWGLVSFLDNAYDGKEAIIAAGQDPWGFATGGESANYGDFLDSVSTANKQWLSVQY